MLVSRGKVEAARNSGRATACRASRSDDSAVHGWGVCRRRQEAPRCQSQVSPRWSARRPGQ